MTDRRIMRCEVVERAMGQKLSLVGHAKEFGLCPLDSGEPLKDFNRE